MTDSRSARERLRMASTCVQVGEQHADLLEAWLRSLTAVSVEGGARPMKLGAALASDLDELVWQATGPADLVMAGFDVFATRAGLPPQTRDDFAAQQARLALPEAGTYLEVRSDGADLGWFWPGPVPLALALSELPPGPATEDFVQWVTDARVREVTVLGRSVMGKATRVDLSMADMDPIEAHTALAKRWQVREFSPAQVDLLRRLSGSLGLTLRLSTPTDPDSAGVTDFGLILPNPSTATVVAWLTLAELEHDAVLATFEGFLGVTGPRSMAVGARSGKLTPVLHYDVGEDRRTD